MTLALTLAAAAGVCAAAALVELLAAPPRRTRRTPERPLSHVAGMTVLAARLARRAGLRAAPAGLEARVAAAGAPLGLTARDVGALRWAAACGAALLAVPLAGALPGRLAVVVLPGAALAGFHAPLLALRGRARARGAQVAHELGDVLDLLRVAIAAGLPVARALGEVGRRMDGVLAGELDGAAARIALGVPHGEALRELVGRCPAAGVATLAAAIARAERHGAPLGPALAALAAEARAEHARCLRDAAARAAPKIQLVVALVLVPAVMLVVGAALVRGLGG